MSQNSAGIEPTPPIAPLVQSMTLLLKIFGAPPIDVYTVVVFVVATQVVTLTTVALRPTEVPSSNKTRSSPATVIPIAGVASR